jgi:cell division protein FtsQ
VGLADGITLRFGDGSDAEAKWVAAARILADGELGGLSYIDLRAPERPAVGGASPAPGAA